MTITDLGDTTIALPGKRLDTNTAPDVEKALLEKIEADRVKIVFDFSKTDYISSAGLRVILKTAKTASQKGGKITICNANAQIHEVLEISGFLTMFEYYDNMDDAVSKLG